MKYLALIPLFISAFAQASENNHFDNFIENFYQHFSQRNLQKISKEYFHKDAQFIFGDHIMVPGSATEIESVFHSIIASLEKDGYQQSVIKAINKNFSGDSYVVATVFFDRLKENNEKLDSMCSTYSAAKLEGKWKILTWLPSKPKSTNACF